MIIKFKQVFGTYGIEQEQMNEAIRWAGEAGYQLVDTAWFYKNEKQVGAAVRKYNETHSVPLLIQTKLWPQFNDKVREVFAEQLEALGVKKIHSYILHRPAVDFNSSIRAWNVLIELQKEGLVDHIGVSNFDKDMLQLLIGSTGVRPECNQIELSVTNYREDRVKVNKEMGIPIQSWSPMGKDNNLLRNKTVEQIARNHQISPGQVLLAYLTTDDLCPVVKSSNEARIKQNWKASDIRLSAEEISALRKLNEYANKYEETFPHEYSDVK